MATLHADAFLLLVGYHSFVKSPDRAVSPKQIHQTSTTKKQPQTTTTTCFNINKLKITNFTKSLLKSSIKHSSSDKGSNQKATQVHSKVDNRQDAKRVETSLKCDEKIPLNKNEDRLQAYTKKTIGLTRKGKKVSKNIIFINSNIHTMLSSIMSLINVLK